MPRLLIILLLSCAYIGCALSVPQTAEHREPGSRRSPERPRQGGELRVLVGSGLSEVALTRSCAARPLAPEGLARSVRPPDPDRSATPSSPCWRFDLAPAEAGAGRAVGPGEWIAAWERELRDSSAPHRWLLQPVLGAEAFALGLASRVEGLREEGEILAVCTSRPTPDLPVRLSHPALWYHPEGGTGGAAVAAGPFRPAADGHLDAVPGTAGGPPYLERVGVVDDRGLPALLLRLGEADLGVVLGSDAGRLLDAPGCPLRLARIEDWDRVYYLWLDPGRRWVNDPPFRRWLSSILDREAMLAYLFDGRGEPAAGLLPGDPPEPIPAGPLARPLAAASRPRLDLCFDAADPLAASIAARARAVLELHGVELEPDPRDAAELAAALSRGRLSMALLAHRPGLADPVLALTESLIGLPGLPLGAREALLEGSHRVDAQERRLAARRVEADLVREGILIPLVRLHAWLASDPALRGVRVGSDGLLFLEEAWWAK